MGLFGVNAMDKIRKLARLSVMRASGFSSLAILMVMMGSAHDPATSFRLGAGGMLILSLGLWYFGESYHRRCRRVTDTEVWLMLPEPDRPSKETARRLIISAMRAELLQKSGWAAVVALGFIGASGLIMLSRALY